VFSVQYSVFAVQCSVFRIGLNLRGRVFLVAAGMDDIGEAVGPGRESAPAVFSFQNPATEIAGARSREGGVQGSEEGLSGALRKLMKPLLTGRSIWYSLSLSPAAPDSLALAGPGETETLLVSGRFKCLVNSAYLEFRASFTERLSMENVLFPMACHEVADSGFSSRNDVL